MKLRDLLIEQAFPPLYHGTGSAQLAQTGQFKGKEVYLTDDETQAPYYAHGLHLGGTVGDVKYILTVYAKDGKILDADNEIQQIVMDEHEQFRDIDDFADEMRQQGYHYLTFNHPSFDKQEYHNVVVSLHPTQDLKVVDVEQI